MAQSSKRKINETPTGAFLGYAGEEECEFHMPDEERFYPLAYYACPICRSESRLWRIGDGKGLRFQVECTNKKCAHKTGWHKSSAEATRIWKLTAVLTND